MTRPTSRSEPQLALDVGAEQAVPKPVPRVVATEANIQRGIERRYGEGWHIMHQVANCLGWVPSAWSVKYRGGVSRRYLDSVAVGMYQRTKHEVHGLEIKVRRDDWLAELRKPEKSGAFSGLVNRFWIVAPKGVVKPDELPDGWGSLVWYPSMMRQMRGAALQKTVHSPTWIAALIARAVKPKRVEGEDQ